MIYMSWIEEEEKILQIEHNPQREKMTSIKCYYVYVNKSNHIEKIITEDYPRSDSGGGSSNIEGQTPLEFAAGSLPENKQTTLALEISTNKVLQMIQSKKIYTPRSKYVFKEAFLFVVDIKPENIQEWIHESVVPSNYSKNFWKKINITTDISIPPSVSVFHKINSIYFFFEEKESIPTHTPKPILKKVLLTKKMDIKKDKSNKTHKKVFINQI